MEFVAIPDAGLRSRIASAPQSALQYVEIGLSHARHLADVIEKQGLTGKLHVLDFGCGCARILQFLRIINPEWVLTGCDVDAPAIAWNTAHIPYAAFARTSARPPLPYPAESLDAAYALSVFTHLDIGMQTAWLDELSRVLKPNGILYFSTNGRFVFDRCKDQLSPANVSEFEEAGFTFIRNIGDGVFPEWYQTSIQTESFLRKNVPSSLQIVQHTPQGLLGWQDSIVAGRR